jgi:spore coat protein U-like protein
LEGCLAQNCSVRVITLQFGDYDPLSGSTLDAEADVYVTCDPVVTYNIRLDAGANVCVCFICTPTKTSVPIMPNIPAT